MGNGYLNCKCNCQDNCRDNFNNINQISISLDNNDFSNNFSPINTRLNNSFKEELRLRGSYNILDKSYDEKNYLNLINTKEKLRSSYNFKKIKNKNNFSLKRIKSQLKKARTNCNFNHKIQDIDENDYPKSERIKDKSSPRERIYLDNPTRQIILLQSIIKSYIFRQKYNLKIRKKQIKEQNIFITKIEPLFSRNKNIKNAEKIFGLFNKESWKNFYKEGDNLFPNNNNEKENENEIKTFNYCDEIKNRIFREPAKEDYGNIFYTAIKIDPFYEKNLYKGYETIEGVRQGYGVLIQKNGAKIEGYWRNNNLDGWGRITDKDGTILEGLFIQGKIFGKGIKKTLEGLVYIGEFYEGLKEGRGVEETKQTKYEGEFQKDEKHGKGKLFFKNLNESYEGEFSHNCINGNGVYIWSNGNKYEGNFVNGKMDGIGLFIWADGSKYYGEYKNNIKEGKGKFIWPNGKILEGNFKKGLPDGKGRISLKDDEGKEIESTDVEFEEGKIKE